MIKIKPISGKPGKYIDFDVKILFHRYMFNVISDPISDGIFGIFYEKELQKINQAKFMIQK